jgi:hypothetical protein
MRFGVVLAGALVALAAAAVAAGSFSAAAAADHPVVQLSGTNLAAALLPVSDLPRGYRLARNSPDDSGTRLETTATKYHLATMNCATYYDAYGGTGFGETAFAEVTFVDLAAGRGTGILQQVYQFRAASTALSFWHGLRAITARCPDLGFALRPGTISTHLTSGEFPGYPAFRVYSAISGPQTGRVRTTTLIVAAGKDVFTVSGAGYSGPGPSDSSLRMLAEELIARVRTTGA